MSWMTMTAPKYEPEGEFRGEALTRRTWSRAPASEQSTWYWLDACLVSMVSLRGIRHLRPQSTGSFSMDSPTASPGGSPQMFSAAWLIVVIFNPGSTVMIPSSTLWNMASRWVLYRSFSCSSRFRSSRRLLCRRA